MPRMAKGTLLLGIGLVCGGWSSPGFAHAQGAPAATAGAAAGTAATTAGAALKTGVVHCVRTGDTLFSIALRYGTTVAAIAKANGIANVNLIFPGQCLQIPAGSAAGNPGTGGMVGKPTGPSCTAMAPPGNAPFVFVTSPTVGAQVHTGFTVTGCANVFEAVVEWKLRDSQGAQIGQGSTMATCGTGCVGSFTFAVAFVTSAPQVGSLEVYHSAPSTGAPVYVNTIPLVLLP